MKGIFITFEGIEASGKSTQAYYFYNTLIDSGIDAILTKEPGGTEVGKTIRKILLESSHVYPLAELFLFLADRNQHVNEKIIPALLDGKIVICDRYYHSTYAYQIGARKLDEKLVKTLNEIAIENLRPDLTFFIDIPVEESFKRKKIINEDLDRIEKESKEFHEAIREYYKKMAKSDYNIFTIDGTLSVSEISDIIIELFKRRFPGYL